jgi:hypothetical protein
LTQLLIIYNMLAAMKELEKDKIVLAYRVGPTGSSANNLASNAAIPGMTRPDRFLPKIWRSKCLSSDKPSHK